MTPPKVLLAIARSGDMSFEGVWPAALAAAVDTAQWERDEWQDILSSMVETWRAALKRCYAPPPESALLALVTPGGRPLPERACEEPVRAERRGHMA
jgi:hypothetical protein